MLPTTSAPAVASVLQLSLRITAAIPTSKSSRSVFITRWTPVKNLTFSGEVMYTRLDQHFTGASTLTPSAPKPTAVYEYKDQDTVTMNVRVQRNF